MYWQQCTQSMRHAVCAKAEWHDGRWQCQSCNLDLVYHGSTRRMKPWQLFNAFPVCSLLHSFACKFAPVKEPEQRCTSSDEFYHGLHDPRHVYKASTSMLYVAGVGSNRNLDVLQHLSCIGYLALPHNPLQPWYALLNLAGSHAPAVKTWAPGMLTYLSVPSWCAPWLFLLIANGKDCVMYCLHGCLYCQWELRSTIFDANCCASILSCAWKTKSKLKCNWKSQP